MNRAEFLARPTSHRVLLLRFVYAVSELRELDQLFVSASLAAARVNPTDSLTDQFCHAGIGEVEASYKKLIRETKILTRWAKRAGIPPEELQQVYLRYWPERLKLVAPDRARS